MVYGVLRDPECTCSETSYEFINSLKSDLGNNMIKRIIRERVIVIVIVCITFSPIFLNESRSVSVEHDVGVVTYIAILNSPV